MGNIWIIFFLVGPSLITWFLQTLLKFNEKYIGVVFCFTAGCYNYSVKDVRQSTGYWEYPMSSGQWIGLSMLFFSMSIWSLIRLFSDVRFLEAFSRG
jgi:hypothetical protein